VCRICLDGDEAQELVSPCQCRGSQGLVHKACLYRWRQLQVLQGEFQAAAQCEICRTKYPASLSQPNRPLGSDFGAVLLETLCGLGVYIQRSSFVSFLTFAGVPVWQLGICRAFLAFAVLFPLLVLMLYLNGMKLSVLGTHNNEVQLGITCFGPPVDGISSGMLLVSIRAGRAGGTFHRTVLYVIDHHDRGSLAVILNKTLSDAVTAGSSVINNNFSISLRDGGPVQSRGLLCIHDIEGVPGAEEIVRGEPIFLTRHAASLQWLQSMSDEQVPGDARERHVLVVRGVSSWGPQQLEGELRRRAWGWIRPEHVQPEDIIETDAEELDRLWGRLVVSQHLEVFEG